MRKYYGSLLKLNKSPDKDSKSKPKRQFRGFNARRANKSKNKSRENLRKNQTETVRPKEYTPTESLYIFIYEILQDLFKVKE